MNIYADRGNLLLLQRRCAWRGIGFELTPASLGDRVDPDAHDLFYLGGGQDRDQALCARDLVETKRDALHAAAGRGAAILAVCGGYQLLGHSYALGDEELPGIGLVDLRTAGACSPASRTTAGGRTSGPARSRWGACSRATGTPAPPATRACAATTSSAPTCTAPCCRRTRGSPTG
jgi:CobQ-like glutamine amidotransferase family enzyme